MIDKLGWVDLEIWTGRQVNGIPRSIRDENEPITHCSSIVAATGDPACDPRSGGLGDVRTMAKIYGVGVQQFRRNLLPNLHYMCRLGDVPVTNQNSIYADAALYRAKMHQIWRHNLGIHTDVSSGSSLRG